MTSFKETGSTRAVLMIAVLALLTVKCTLSRIGAMAECLLLLMSDYLLLIKNVPLP